MLGQVKPKSGWIRSSSSYVGSGSS